MTKQEIVEIYGQSIYQIWLRVAISAFRDNDAHFSFKLADQFVAALLERESPFLK